MGIMTIGIDLAKNVFAVHGVDENGKAVLIKPKVSREQLLPLVAQLPPCRIGIAACSGARHWDILRRHRNYEQNCPFFGCSQNLLHFRRRVEKNAAGAAVASRVFPEYCPLRNRRVRLRGGNPALPMRRLVRISGVCAAA